MEDETPQPALTREQLASAIQLSPVPTAIGGSDGSIISFNTALEQLTGYQRAEIADVGEWIVKLYPDERYRDVVWKNIQQALRGKEQDCTEFTITCKDGSTRIVDFKTAFFEGGLMIQMLDVSWHRRIEALAQRKVQEQRLLLDTIDTQIWYLTHMETYGRLNRAHADFLGRDVKDIAHKRLEEFLSKEVAEVCKASNMEVFETRRPLHTEEWIPNADGQKRLIAITKTPKLDEKGNVEYVVCAGTDITEVHAAEERLRASEAKYRRLVRNLPAVVYQFHMDATGLLTFPYIAENVMAMMGVPAETVMRDSSLLLNMVHPDDRDMFHEGVLGSAQTLQPYQARFRYINGGETLWMEARSVPEAQADGSVLWDGFFVDITDVKRLERAVQDRQDNFQAFFDTMTDMVFVARLDGSIIHANPAAGRVLGYGPDEFASMHILDVHRPSDRREAETLLAEMFRGDRHVCPLPLMAKDGSVVPVDTRVWFGKWGGDPCLFGVSKDLSAEREAQQRFERLFHNNPALMAVSRMPDRRFTEVNSAFLTTLGYGKSEIIGRTSSELGLFTDQEQQDAIARTLAAEGRFMGRELPVRCRDGSIRNGLFSGEIIQSQGRDYFLTVMVDITERKIAVDGLKRRIALERLVGEIASDLAGAGSDQTDPIIIRALSALADFIGADRAYIFQFRNGGARMDNTHEWCAPGIEPQLEHLQGISFGTELPYFAERIRKREVFHVPDVGALPAEALPERRHFEAQGIQSLIAFPVETSGVLLGFFGFDAVRSLRTWTDDDQSLLRFIGNTIGYAVQRTQSEAHRFALERRLHQVEKAESLSRMAGAVAHHFNNLLSAVMGNLDLVQMDLPPGTVMAERLTAAHHATRRAADMSRLMLTYLGQTPTNPIPLDLSAACADRLAQIRGEIPQGVILEIDLPTPGPVVEADPAQVGQVVASLVTNARESMENGSGHIRLAVLTAKESDIRQVHRFPVDLQAPTGMYACLTVSDSGRGMAGKTIDRIFDPFYTDKFTGRGLGLAVTLGIVKSFGGCIAVESEPGRGSTFRVLLPLSSKALPESTPEKPMAGQEVAGGGVILLVEDQLIVRDATEAMLKCFGFEVLTARDGVEAVNIFREKMGDIRLVLTDLSMPRMNGWETLKALRKIRPDIPVILASGYDEARAMAGDHAERPQVFLNKPYQMETLKQAVVKALTRQL